MRAMKRLSESQIIRFFQKQNSKEFVAEDVEIFLLGKRNCATSIDTLVQSTDIPPKSNFSDIARKIAHEVKNPLTPIKLSAERIEKKIDENDIDKKIFNSLAKTTLI